MKWVEPGTTSSQVQRAGKLLVKPDTSPEDRASALLVVDNWRSAHGFPLNTLTQNLHNHAMKVDPNADVVRRMKRMPSIEKKLTREPTMSLTKMQDLGGCRAIVATMAEVDQLVQSIANSRQRHTALRPSDYIAAPKRSGYRSVHLPFAYQSRQNTVWNGLLIEMQIRTRIQHAWATAVETVSVFTGQDLKASQGDPDWLRFFALASSVFATRESQPPVPDTPTDYDELIAEVQALAEKLNVRSKLEGYRTGMTVSEAHSNATYFVLELRIQLSDLVVYAFQDAVDAAATYAVREAETDTDTDVVMVGADDMAALRDAYPNYFGDTSLFIKLFEEAGIWPSS